LSPRYQEKRLRDSSYGSIIAVVGTNAPLSSHQINRLCKRAALGIGRVGSFAAHGSGEIILGFSNGNMIPRISKRKNRSYHLKVLLEEALDPLYRAAIEATEEAILNSLFMATTMEGRSGNIAPELPLDFIEEIFADWQKISEKNAPNP
jgi:D-aminopeptidase